MFNVARVLAKLSLHESIRQGINADPRHLLDLLDLLHSTASWALVRTSGPAGPAAAQGIALMVRLAFTLGNLTASNERNRAAVLKSGGCGGLVHVLCAAHEAHGFCEGEAREEAEDLLVKLIRLVANLSISGEAGPALVRLEGVACLVPILRASLDANREELLLNAVSAVTNLSFYGGGGGGSGGSGGGGSVVLRESRPLIAVLVEVLLHENEEAVAEAARAFGNFSRLPDGRQAMAAARADEALVILLDHAARDVVLAAAGALVNMGSDPSCFEALLASPAPGAPNGCAKLVSLVRRLGLRDSPLAAVCCKALYNSLGAAHGAGAAGRGLDGRELARLAASLEELLEVTDEDEDFCTAAGALLRLVRGIEEEEQARAAEASQYEELEPPPGHK